MTLILLSSYEHKEKNREITKQGDGHITGQGHGAIKAVLPKSKVDEGHQSREWVLSQLSLKIEHFRH